jgi:hypothetical protein
MTLKGVAGDSAVAVFGFDLTVYAMKTSRNVD